MSARRIASALLAAAPIALRLLAGETEPALDSRRYNEVQFKAAHNSIDREETIEEQLDWKQEEPHQGGCRGIELDLVLDPARCGADSAWVFGVQHGGAFGLRTPLLRDSLRRVRRWAEAHPRHEVVTIHLDLKSEATLGEDRLFPAKIDEVLAAELGRERIFTPAALKRHAPTLLAGARRHGWPSLGELRGKFILVFSGSDLEEPVARRRRAYLAARPAERLCFVDLDQRAAGAGGADECDIKNPYYQEGARVFVNLQLGRGDWPRLARGAAREGLVTREWKANDEASWKLAREAGVHILSTDRIRGHPWAAAGRDLFAGLPGPQKTSP